MVLLCCVCFTTTAEPKQRQGAKTSWSGWSGWSCHSWPSAHGNSKQKNTWFLRNKENDDSMKTIKLKSLKIKEPLLSLKKQTFLLTFVFCLFKCFWLFSFCALWLKQSIVSPVLPLGLFFRWYDMCLLCQICRGPKTQLVKLFRIREESRD